MMTRSQKLEEWILSKMPYKLLGEDKELTFEGEMEGNFENYGKRSRTFHGIPVRMKKSHRKKCGPKI